MRRCDGRWGDAMDDEAMPWGDAMDDEAMRWKMRRCDGRWGDAMDDEAMRWGDGNIAPSHRLIASPHRPSHRLIVHRIASSSIASPHRPSHRLIVHRIASSSIASPHRLPLRNASWTTGCSSCACLTHCGLGSWTHRPTVLSAPVSVDASPHWTYSPTQNPPHFRGILQANVTKSVPITLIISY